MMGTPKKKMKLVVANEDTAYAARLAAGRERFSRIVTELQQRAVRICASNNPRRATAMDLPCALDAPGSYQWVAYEFGSHNFDWLRAMYKLSGRRCGVVGIDADPNMPAHLSMTFEEFYLYHRSHFLKCKPDACMFAGNCCSFSKQSETHHGRSVEPVNSDPDTHECAEKIEFGNQTLKYVELIMLAAWEVNPLCIMKFETPAGYCSKQPIYNDVFLHIFGLRETRLCKCKCFGTKYRKEINIVNNMQCWDINSWSRSQRMCTASHLCNAARANGGRHPKVVAGAASQASARFGVVMAESLARVCLLEMQTLNTPDTSIRLR